MDILAKLYFSEEEITMLYLCPIFAAIGGFLHILMSSCDLTKWPESKPSSDLNLSSGDWKSQAYKLVEFVLKGVIKLPVVLIHSPYWIVARLALSVLTGLIVGLYFIGVLPESSGGIARIFALSVFIGYVSPILWLAKEKWVLSVVESKVFKDQLSKTIMEAYNGSRAVEKEKNKPTKLQGQ